MARWPSFFYDWIVFLCVCVCTHWWILRLCPYLGYCKQCSCEHGDACVFPNQCFCFLPMNEYAEVELLESYGNCIFFFFFEESPYWFPWWLHQFTVPPTVHKGSLFSTSSPALVSSCLFEDSRADRCKVISYRGLVCISLMTSNVEHLYVYLFVCLFRKNVLRSSDRFLSRWLGGFFGVFHEFFI